MHILFGCIRSKMALPRLSRRQPWIWVFLWLFTSLLLVRMQLLAKKGLSLVMPPFRKSQTSRD